MLRLYSLALFLLLLLAGRLASAQSRSAVDPLWLPDTTRQQPEAVAAPDTAAALHRLFAAKRSSRNKVLAATLLGSGAVVGVTLAANSGPCREAYTAIGALALGILLVPPALVIELVAYNNSYSRRQERLTIADWQAHRLAPYMRRRLEPRYFEPTGPRQP